MCTPAAVTSVGAARQVSIAAASRLWSGPKFAARLSKNATREPEVNSP